jgi:DNA polymerase-4
MNRLGVGIGLDLRAQTLHFLQEHFGKSGPSYHSIAAERPVCAGRVRKSVGAENTFAQDLHEFAPMREAPVAYHRQGLGYCQAAGA